MDDIDRRILREFQCDGRLSNAELSKRVNLSASATLRRVQELERAGVIQGYRAVIDREAVGGGFLAYITVRLSSHTKKAQMAFEQAMATADQVRECHNITGVYEYLLRVETACLQSYKTFHTEVLGQAPYVDNITTYIVMASPKDTRS